MTRQIIVSRRSPLGVTACRRPAFRVAGVLVLLAAIVACAAPPARHSVTRVEGIEDAVQHLASQLVLLAPADDEPFHIGVVCFDSTNGETLLGERLAHDLSGALAAELTEQDIRSARVVTRHHLVEVIREQDLFGHDGAESFGRLVGADLLVTGLLTPGDDAVHVSAQLVAVGNGEVIGAVRADLDRTSDVAALLASRVGETPPAGPGVALAAGEPRSTDAVLASLPLVIPPATEDHAAPFRESAAQEPDRSDSPHEVTFLQGESAFSRSRRLRAGDAPVAVLPETRAGPFDALPALVVDTEPLELLVDDGMPRDRVRILARVGIESLVPDAPLRRPTHFCMALDLSGSMGDRKRLDQAIVAVDEVLGTLGPQDWLSIVGFSDVAFPVVKPVRTTDHAKEAIRERMQRVTTGGNTDFEAALKEIAACLRMTRNEGVGHHAVLISDGEPTVGARTPSTLARLAGRLGDSGASLDTIGVGGNYGRDTMLALARDGHGQFLVVDEGEELSDVLVQQVLAAGTIVGGQATLTYTPGDDVSAVNADVGWVSAAGGTWRAELGVLAPGDGARRGLGLTLEGPLLDRARLGDMTLTWIDEEDEVHTRSRELQVDVIEEHPLVSDA